MGGAPPYIAIVGAGGDAAPGTLSEIALALKAGKRVVGLGTWRIDGVQAATDAGEAIELALG